MYCRDECITGSVINQSQNNTTGLNKWPVITDNC